MIYFCNWINTNHKPYRPSTWSLESWKQFGLNVPGGMNVSPLEWLTKLVKESKEDSFCFVLGRQAPYEPPFLKWIKDNGLENWIAFEQPYYSTNEQPFHALRGDGGGLKVYVLQSPEHFQRQAAKDEPSVTEENLINFINWNHEET